MPPLHSGTDLSVPSTIHKAKPRPLLPNTSRTDGPRESPRRTTHSKSRDGCVTCKAKRRKCDELKPSCSQCLMRRVVCGGYNKRELVWKEFGKVDRPVSSTTREGYTLQDKSDSGNEQSTTTQSGKTSEAQQIQAPANRQDDEPSVQYMEHSDPIHTEELRVSFTNIEILPDSGDDHSSKTTEPTNGIPMTPSAFLSSNRDDTPLSDALLDYNFHQDDVIDTDISWFSSPDPANHSSPNAELQGMPCLYRYPAIRDDGPESIAILFDNRICEVLCIKDDPIDNPWRKIVWPLAQDCPALYHAIAAMTCFNGFHIRPQLLNEGFRHLQSSMSKLSLEVDSSSRHEVTLIVLLALSIAQTWFHPRVSNGISYINKAKTLLQEVLSRDLSSQPLEGNICLGFLANTWLYLDVLTRVTCRNVQAMDLNLLATCSFMGSGPGSFYQIDPLMGCAGTLFPLIGRVADLVRRVRNTSSDMNSPATVSLAVDLRVAIEGWNPSVEATSEQEGSTSNKVDIIQTANSYKWATLLLLLQAVPEIPSQLSYADMARQVLVLIATVPLSSRAVIFHVLPLMIAGCEATEAEDRDWVRNRWTSMLSGNSSGIVERSLELTLEVWKRRDTYKTTDVYTGLDLGMLVGNDIHQSMEPFMSPVITNQATATQNGSSMTEARTKKEFTVKGRSHWLNVMEEWGWEVMLG